MRSVSQTTLSIPAAMGLLRGGRQPYGETEAMPETGTRSENLESGTISTVFSIFISAVATGDLSRAEALLADDVEWNLMPAGQRLNGKAEVMPWLRAGTASRKEPIPISDRAAGDWGVFEYWNIGTVTEELVEFGNQQNWPWSKDPNDLIGQSYKVAQCFVWRLNADGKICLMRQYLDTGSVWTQFRVAAVPDAHPRWWASGEGRRGGLRDIGH